MGISSVAFGRRKLEGCSDYHIMECLSFPGLLIRNFNSAWRIKPEWLTKCYRMTSWQIPEPTSLKAYRIFVDMVDYLRDSINGLSGYLIPLTMLTKKRCSSEEFNFTKNSLISFEKSKKMEERTKLTIMNEQSQLVLYTDASTKAIS